MKNGEENGNGIVAVSWGEKVKLARCRGFNKEGKKHYEKG